MFDNKDNFLSE